jgi:hypothetical protein
VLIRPADLERIRTGEVDLAFRRWDRPRLRAGTRMRTVIGLVEATAVDRVAAADITDADARRAGFEVREELLRRLAAHPERPVFRVALRFAGADPRIALRQRDDLSADEQAALVARLDRLDRAATAGPWTYATLTIIDRNPARRAPDLAAELDRDTAAFKRDVRKLKELGLTESLPVGYRLSARGLAVLRILHTRSGSARGTR